LDAKIILANTYHLFLRPGPELIEKLGGLHRFMSWDRAILTDSGGFQVFSLNANCKISDEGVLFHSHLNGDAHLFTPQSTIDAQLAFGSDIAMVLDECPLYPVSHTVARAAMLRTVQWAGAGYRHYLKRERPDTAVFPIVQGSMFADLRSECAERLLELDAPGYAIGGLSVGVGTPQELAEYVARGADMFDCVMPSRNARNGYLFASHGRVVIKQAQYRDDPAPVDAECTCYTCRTFSRAYLRHLFQAGEMLFSTLATIHNLKHYLERMKSMRAAILNGTFPEFLHRLKPVLPQNR
jgi:queuine tRNA-ribosyltransferase